MIDYESNVYYHPEKSSLEIVSSVDTGEMYEFDIVAVFRDVETGQLYIGSDAGCSCPMPFEDMTRDDLRPIKGKYDVLAEVRDRYGMTSDKLADLLSGW